METAEKSKKKKDRHAAVTDDKSESTRQKAGSVATNESSVAAELKNREHGNEQPGR